MMPLADCEALDHDELINDGSPDDDGPNLLARRGKCA